MDKLVSIIIPVYNRVNLVSIAIECAINQTYSNIEIIIGDNCSTDGTWELLQEYAQIDSRIHIFKNDENIGPVRNWLECVKRTKGDFIKILFSDDWIDYNWIEEAIKPLKDKRIGFSFTPAEIFIPDKVSFIRYNWYVNNRIISSDYYIFRNYFKGNAPVSPGCALFRRNDVVKNLFVSIENPLGIDYAQHGGGIDMLLFLYTAKQYEKIAYIQTTKAFFFGGDDSITLTQNLIDSYLYARIFFMNDYKSFSLIFWLKLFRNRSKFVKLLKVKATVKDLKILLFFCKKQICGYGY